jgi:integrase
MQHGSLGTKSRLEGPDVWQFRWSEKDPNGKRVDRKRVIGTAEEYPDAGSARNSESGLISELIWANPSYCGHCRSGNSNGSEARPRAK